MILLILITDQLLLRYKGQKRHLSSLSQNLPLEMLLLSKNILINFNYQAN